jgi:hypothetical protein
MEYTTTAGNFFGSKHFADRRAGRLRETFITSFCLFLLSYVLLFLGMSLRPNIYDEGIVLTAAMRVAAGQVPHRDFYTPYGPAQYYLLAGLFKLFGESILVERLFDLFIRALIVTSVYTIASSYCRRSVAACTSIAAILWLFGLNYETSGAATIPVSLLNLVGTTLVLPAFSRTVSRRRMLTAGAVAGIAAMFRYDTGVALLVIQACIAMIAVCLRVKSEPGKLRAFASAFWPCLLGFVAVTLPPAAYYLSVAPLHPFVHDIILYPLKYYHRSRNLPYPVIHLANLDSLADYLPIAIAGISLYVTIARCLRVRRNEVGNSEIMAKELEWRGFLIAFGLLTSVMYLKGIVRISPVQMYLCTVPSLLLLAVLYQHQLHFPRFLRMSIVGLVWLSGLAAGWSSLYRIVVQCSQHSFALESLLSSAMQTTPVAKTAWCKVTNGLTRELCFVPDEGRIRAIEFIDNHTRPDQLLYVGLTKHDMIAANDNLFYFAAQRLPATRWSHFDPDLQNREDVQSQMVHELETGAPPYVVLDSEFELAHEPNDSSVSSGVALLDEYLARRYRHVETFGTMSIWQRVDIP